MQPRTETQTLYPQTVTARFSDTFGSADAVITVDGTSVFLHVRGAEFVAQTEFDFSIVARQEGQDSERFQWDKQNYLAQFTLSFSLMVPVIDSETQALSQLDAFVERGAYGVGTKTDLILHWNGSEYAVTYPYGEFEFLLEELARLLPADVYLKNCYNCLFSDYSPCGVSGFGDMTCHREHKQEYLAVKTKWDYFALPSGERVQELYLCPEWEKRIKGTGYRG